MAKKKYVIRRSWGYNLAPYDKIPDHRSDDFEIEDLPARLWVTKYSPISVPCPGYARPGEGFTLTDAKKMVVCAQLQMSWRQLNDELQRWQCGPIPYQAAIGLMRDMEMRDPTTQDGVALVNDLINGNGLPYGKYRLEKAFMEVFSTALPGNSERQITDIYRVFREMYIARFVSEYVQ